MKNTVLVVEDDPNLNCALSDMLSRENYSVINVSTLQDAYSKIDENIDIVLLDWMLPDGQGIDFCAEVKKKNLDTPIIFLTARVDSIDKVLGLELGASDYVTKPFDSRELLARVRVRLREKSKKMSSSVGVDGTGGQANVEQDIGILKRGELHLDRNQYRAQLKGKPIELAKKEFELLFLMAEFPGKVFSRDELLNKIWGFDNFPTTRTVDTHVLLLRQKIGEKYIETVRAVGYRFATNFS